MSKSDGGATGGLSGDSSSKGSQKGPSQPGTAKQPDAQNEQNEWKTPGSEDGSGQTKQWDSSWGSNDSRWASKPFAQQEWSADFGLDKVENQVPRPTPRAEDTNLPALMVYRSDQPVDQRKENKTEAWEFYLEKRDQRETSRDARANPQEFMMMKEEFSQGSKADAYHELVAGIGGHFQKLRKTGLTVALGGRVGDLLRTAIAIMPRTVDYQQGIYYEIYLDAFAQLLEITETEALGGLPTGASRLFPNSVIEVWGGLLKDMNQIREFLGWLDSTVRWRTGSKDG